MNGSCRCVGQMTRINMRDTSFEHSSPMDISNAETTMRIPMAKGTQGRNSKCCSQLLPIIRVAGKNGCQPHLLEPPYHTNITNITSYHLTRCSKAQRATLPHYVEGTFKAPEPCSSSCRFQRNSPSSPGMANSCSPFNALKERTERAISHHFVGTYERCQMFLTTNSSFVFPPASSPSSPVPEGMAKESRLLSRMPARPQVHKSGTNHTCVQ